MSSVEVMSWWICLETVLEQGFPSLTSTTVRVSGYFHPERGGLPSLHLPMCIHPSGVLHNQVSPTDPRTTGIACSRLIKDLREGGGVSAEARIFLSPILPRYV
ncbi:uncharacterized protein LOC111106794 isoform X2 [Crassostrea virginica]